LPKRILCSIAILAAALGLPLRGQTISGSIAGTVIDPSQAAVVNAKVTAMEQEKKLASQTQTDATGRFVFPQLQPGTYSITVEVQGFKKLDRADITLNGNEKLAIGNLQLQVGTIDQSVEVRAEALQLQTESGERSQTMNSKVMENIAINGRSYLPLTVLVPGVTTVPSLQTAGHSGIGSISANGGRQNQNKGWAMWTPGITATSSPRSASTRCRSFAFSPATTRRSMAVRRAPRSRS
jgi:hypothetical protein